MAQPTPIDGGVGVGVGNIEGVFIRAWQSLVEEQSIPALIYPAGVNDARLHVVTSSLVRWLGTPEGQAHVAKVTAAIATGDVLPDWHLEKETLSRLIPEMNCQSSEMVFGFCEWLSEPEGESFIAGCQAQITPCMRGDDAEHAN